ncbi:DNA polymerase III subunit epsilon [Caulobacter sp. 17J65-9]|uniref:DNA polymerase III subunit epsilon n=1 Tax=Caulobacter sp. 17J65-9 TaxID=2709382 RepID=UPI0013C8D5B6|nr:DNA polymerase III subunit epsilon [Caulobacter sp. 17J65-9]NEX91508.1 DNA polymerase III subunit epsilon [Caulobacter sp. 17J65-9]
MAREIVLDTETTGIDPKSGHRLIEIACVEIVDLLPTGKSLHRLVNPEREIEADAERVHGISNAMVANKPKFIEIVDELIAFIDGAPIVAHNAGFDRGFVNMELERIGRKQTQPGDWIDTLQLAQKRFPGMPNSLDALCRRFKISLAEREKHGALIDAQLLAAVYLELRGGKERGLDLTPVGVATAITAVKSGGYGPRPRPLASRVTDDERAAHAAFVSAVLKDKAIWAQFAKTDESEPA